MNQTKKKILIILASIITSMLLLVLRGPSHDFFGFKVFTGDKKISLAYKMNPKENQTIYTLESDRFITGKVSKDKSKIHLGNISHSIKDKESYIEILKIPGYALGLIVFSMIVIVVGRNQYEKKSKETS